MVAGDIVKQLQALGQPHLAVGLSCLSMAEQEQFLAQIQQLSANLLQQQRASLAQKDKAHPLAAEPVQVYDTAGSATDQLAGEQLLAAGKIGCIILAGGAGSRLGTDGPKGLTPVTLIKNKSLFQLFFEKTSAASHRAGRALPLAIMTSPANHLSTVEYLTQADWFGLDRDQIDLFSQGALPLLDEAGNWQLTAPGQIAEGPDGNGSFLTAFYASGIWAKWQQVGVEAVNIILIDNPLADPFDAELCGYHHRAQAEATVKCIAKSDPLEKVGTIVSDKGRIKVIEYSEFPPSDALLRSGLANISLFCFAMTFLGRLARLPAFALPWHLAYKPAQVWKDGAPVTAMLWKFETFIFDILQHTPAVKLLVYPRERCFAPLKNMTGEASLATVQSALLAWDRAVYFQVSGLQPPDRPFELDPLFHYPTAAVLEKWRGRPLPNCEYIRD